MDGRKEILIIKCVWFKFYEGRWWDGRGPQQGKTTTKVIQSGFWRPTIFEKCMLYVQECLKCLKTDNILNWDEIPLNRMLEVKPFYYWGIEFMGPFPPSNFHVYILVCEDYEINGLTILHCGGCYYLYPFRVIIYNN